MHEEIKNYTIEGIVDEGNVSKNKDNLIRFLESDMRDEGYVPDLEKDPQYSQSYQPEDENFLFKLTVYGIYVGMEKAWQVDGIMGGKTIMKSIPPAKSRES